MSRKSVFIQFLPSGNVSVNGNAAQIGQVNAHSFMVEWMRDGAQEVEIVVYGAKGSAKLVNINSVIKEG